MSDPAIMPDRLGDAIRALATGEHLRFAVREGDTVRTYDVRLVRERTRVVPRGQKAFRRVGGVLSIDPDPAFSPAPATGARQMAETK